MLISNKLLSLLKTFSKHDLNNFNKFISSPFHNESQELVQLFVLLDNHFRTSEKEQKENPLEKEKVWKEIFGTKSYQDVRLRRLSSDLIKAIYAFLAYKVYQKNTINSQIDLLKSLSKSSLQKHYESTLGQVSQSLEKSPLRNAEYHLSKYSISYNRLSFPKEIKSKKALFENIEQADYHLECFYITQKLENYCGYLSYNSVISLGAQLELPPDFLDYVENSKYIKEPAIKAYFLVAKMLLAPKEETYFFSLKEHVERNTTCFTLNELDVFYIHLKNYCIDTKINKGRTEYFARLFEIFQALLKEKIILKEGNISPQNYKNIITVGLQVEAYEWVENFIEEHTKNLPKENRENAHSYNLAKVYFYQKKYNEAIEHLQSVEYRNHVYALGGKLLLLKTYYEIKEFIALDSLIDSFRIYIRRNKIISREVKQQYLNMLRFVKKLASTIPGDQKAIDKIHLQIDNCKALAGKKWILEKVAELS